MGGFNSELGPSNERRSKKWRAQRRHLSIGVPLGTESILSIPYLDSQIRFSSSTYLHSSACLSAVGKTAGKRADRHVQVESRSINEMAIVQRPELEQERDDYARSGRKGKFHSMIFRSKYSVEKQCSPDSGVDKWNGITGSHTVNGLGGVTRGLWSDLGMKA